MERINESFDDLYANDVKLSLNVVEKGKVDGGDGDNDDDQYLSLDEKIAKARKMWKTPDHVPPHNIRKRILPSVVLNMPPKPPDPIVDPPPPPPSKSAKTSETNDCKIYVGGLPPSVTEKPLITYFSQFGKVIHCTVVRDITSGISKGFAFVTFLDESMAEDALSSTTHVLEGRPIRVSPAIKNNGSEVKVYKNKSNCRWMEELVLPVQTRIYLGPIGDDVLGDDLRAQMTQFGLIKGVTRLKTTNGETGFGFVEFVDPISVRRAFGRKIFIKGKSVKLACSKMAMTLILSPSVVFFHEAHVRCDSKTLEMHFSQFGQVYRSIQFYDYVKETHKSYGFVDFVDSKAADQILNVRTNNSSSSSPYHLLPPGQYVRICRMLPLPLLMDLLAIGDKEGQDTLKKIESVVPEGGVWGEGASKFNLSLKKNEVITSQVRFPKHLIPRLMGERGKVIAEISRDSKCKIIVPKIQTNSSDPNVIVTLRGLKTDIKTAQYLMQRVLKGLK